jgi:hypothetical protein
VNRTRSVAPEAAHVRSLSPSQRHEWVAYQTAIDVEQRAEQAYEAARSRLNKLLTQWSDISKPDMNLMPSAEHEEPIIAIRGSRSRY